VRTLQHNRPNALSAKQEIREHVLRCIKPAHVFDVFCGPDGEAWRHVWSRAESYIGVDTDWLTHDPRRRYVGDNRIVMRAIDLKAFNVFDFDAFGSPWEQLVILAARRPWAPGERGAVVITDGTSMNTTFGNLPHAMAALLNLKGDGRLAPGANTSEGLKALALERWFARAQVRPLKRWTSFSKSSGVGSAAMTYSAFVFEGLPAGGAAPGEASAPAAAAVRTR
jgi:hypothetical protein